jgi:hypothetical protein
MIKKRPRVKQFNFPLFNAQQLLDIVSPIIKFSTYGLTIDNQTDLTTTKKLLDEVKQTKISLAWLLSATLDTPVNPDELKSISVHVYAYNSNFRVLLTHETSLKIQDYTLVLSVSNEDSMISKLITVVKNASPDATPGEITAQGIALTKIL